MRKTIVLAALAALASWAGVTQAMPICGASVAASVTGTAGCQLGSTNNDFQNPLQVNIDAMFGFSDWLFDAKDDDVNGVNAGVNALALSLIGGTIGGNWSVSSNALSMFSDIMLVFKSGSGDPNTYVGYLLSATSGAYQSPFTNPNNGNLKEISHVSVYVRGSSTTVPEPGIFVLLGAGILAFGLARRRTV